MGENVIGYADSNVLASPRWHEDWRYSECLANGQTDLLTEIANIKNCFEVIIIDVTIQNCIKEQPIIIGYSVKHLMNNVLI